MRSIPILAGIFSSDTFEHFLSLHCIEQGEGIWLCHVGRCRSYLLRHGPATRISSCGVSSRTPSNLCRYSTAVADLIPSHCVWSLQNMPAVALSSTAGLYWRGTRCGRELSWRSGGLTQKGSSLATKKSSICCIKATDCKFLQLSTSRCSLPSSSSFLLLLLVHKLRRGEEDRYLASGCTQFWASGNDPTEALQPSPAPHGNPSSFTVYCDFIFRSTARASRAVSELKRSNRRS